MANDTSTGGTINSARDNLTVAIVLPCLFAVILVILLALWVPTDLSEILWLILYSALLVPRIMHDDGPQAREERRKKRLAELEHSVKAQHFVDWAKKQRQEHPGAPLPAELTHPLW
jgi:E3 ubiquitin-protein ligase RHA2